MAEQQIAAPAAPQAEQNANVAPVAEFGSDTRDAGEEYTAVAEARRRQQVIQRTLDDLRARGLMPPEPTKAEGEATGARNEVGRTPDGKRIVDETGADGVTRRYESDADGLTWKFIGEVAGKVGADVGRGLFIEGPRAAAQGAVNAVNEMLDTFDSAAGWFDANLENLTKDAVGRIEPSGPMGKEVETFTGKAVKGISQFLVGMAPAVGILGKMGLAAKIGGNAGKIVNSMIAGAFSDATAFDPYEEQLGNLIREIPELQGPVTDFLAADPTDSEAERRFSRAIEGLGLGVVAEGLTHGLRALRAIKMAKSIDDVEPEFTREELTGLLGDPDAPVVSRGETPVPEPEAPPLVAPVLDQPADKLAGAARETTDIAPTQQNAQALTSAATRWLETTRKLRSENDATLPEVERLSQEADMAAVGENLDDMVKVIKDLRKGGKGAGKRPQSLISWIVKQGGVKDDGGEILTILGGKPQTRPGLLNSKSRWTLDDLAGHAWELGWFPEHPERIPMNDFIDAIRDDFAGTSRRYHPDDFDKLAQVEARGDFIYELESRGIDWADADEDTLRRQIAAAYGAPGEGQGRTLADLEKETAERAAAGVTGVTRGERVDLGGQDFYVNFARIDQPEDIKSVIGQMADAYKGSIDEAARGVQTHEATKALADELGMTVETLLSRRKGQAFNAEEATAARALLNASAGKLFKLAKEAASNPDPKVQFQFRKAIALHHAIQKEVFAARREAARALNAWAIPADAGGKEMARAVNRTLGEMGGTELSQEIAKRLMILEEEGATKASINAFAERSTYAKRRDALIEVWVNGLLTSPATHFANILGNATIAFQSIMERAAAEGITRSLGATDGIAPGEAYIMTKALIRTVPEAFKMMALSLKHGESISPGFSSGITKAEGASRRAISAEAFGKEGAAGHMIDFVGSVANLPVRFLGAEDALFKTLAYRMELFALAHRKAWQEGARDGALKARVKELIDNPPEELRLASADAALYNTFNKAPNVLGKWVSDGKKRIPVMSFLVPFVRTPANILDYFLERSPLAPLVSSWRADMAAGGARRDLAMARVATGTMLMAWAADLADQGYIRGSGPKGDRVEAQKEAQLRQGKQTYSVKIGDYWVPFDRLDPLGMALGVAANLSEIAQQYEMDDEDLDEAKEVVGAAVAALGYTVISKNYMEGLANFFQIWENPTRYTPEFVQSLVASFVPTGIGAVDRISDPWVRDAEGIWDAIEAKLGDFRDRLPFKRDLWGRRWGKISGFGGVFDAFSPVVPTKENAQPIDAEIERLGVDIRRVEKRTTWQGATVNFREHPAAYEWYVRLAGNELKLPQYDNLGAMDFLNALVEGSSQWSRLYERLSDGPDGGKAQFIKDAIRDYRDAAREALLADPDFADFAEQFKADREEARRARAAFPELQR